jgi:hypothetical protein
VGSLKMNTTLEYSTRVVQEGDRRCKKSTLNDLAYLTPLRIPLMNPVYVLYVTCAGSSILLKSLSALHAAKQHKIIYCLGFFGNLNIFGLQDFFTAFLNALERIFMLLLIFSQLSKIILLWLLV